MKKNCSKEVFLSALPSGNEQRPIVPSAVRVLAEEIGAFDQSSFKPVLKLEHSKAVSVIGYAGNGKTIVTKDDTGIYLWSAQSGELIKKYDNASLGTSIPEVVFDNEGIIKSAGLEKYLGSAFMMDDYNILGYKKFVQDETSISAGNIYIIAGSKAMKLDGNNGDVIWSIEEDNKIGFSDISKAKNAIVRTSSNYDIDGYDIELYDIETGTLFKEYTLKDFDFGLNLDGWIVFSNFGIYPP